MIAAKVFPSLPSRILNYSIVSPNVGLARPLSPLMDLLVLLSPALPPLRLPPHKRCWRASIIGSWMCFKDDVITCRLSNLTRCFTVACGVDIVEEKLLRSIIGRRTTTCCVIGVRSNKSVVLNMTLVISSSPLLYSFDLPRSCMYLVPITFHHRFAGIYGKLIQVGTIRPTR